MSNLTGNGWGEYQRLVLAELERLNVMWSSLDKRMNDVQIQLALLKEENGKIKKLADDVAQQQKALEALTQGDKVDDAIKKYRNWIIGLIFTIAVSVAIPIVNLILTRGGG